VHEKQGFSFAHQNDPCSGDTDKQLRRRASVRPWVAIADDGDIVDEQDVLHEVELGQAVLVEVVLPQVVHRHHQTAELDLRSTVLLGAVPLLELEEVVTDVLPLALLDLDGDAGVGVVEIDAVVKPLMRPELTVRVEATCSSSLVLVLREPVGNRGIEPTDLRVFVDPSKTLAGTASTADRIDANESSENAADEVWARRSLSLVTSSTTTILALEE